MKTPYLAIIICFAVAGCSKPTNRNVDNFGISHFDYNDHQYISFERTTGYQGYLGVVHDPDCVCNNKIK